MHHRKNPTPGSQRDRIVQCLREAGCPMHSRDVARALNVGQGAVATTAKRYPHLLRRVDAGIYEYCGPAKEQTIEQTGAQQTIIKEAPSKAAAEKRETRSPFIVPALRVIHSAKRARPLLRELTDKELIKYHVTSNRNTFKDGVDYEGDILTDIKLTYRASLQLATSLGVPEVRSEIEEAKDRAEGREHVKEFNLSGLMPDGAPAGFPVCFDILIEALQLSRGAAIQKLNDDFSRDHVKSLFSGAKGRPRAHYWLTEEAAKRFVFNSGITKDRKKPIVDYFIRREQEAEDYRQRDKQEQAIETTDLAAALAGMAQAVTAMVTQQQHTTALLTQLVDRQTAQEERIEASEERARLAEEKADEYNHGRTRRIEAASFSYPITSPGAAKRAGIYTKEGKPHYKAMRAIAEGLKLFDYGLAVYDDDSGEHRFVRFNDDGLNIIKAWRQECLDEGITRFEYPRSESSSWHIFFTRSRA